jgi:hypothetical protein
MGWGLTGAGVVLLVVLLLSGKTWWPALAFLAFGLAMIGLRVWAPVQAARQNKHMFGDTCDLELTDREFRQTMGGRSTVLEWKVFRKLRRVGDQWILEMNPAQAIMIPARVLTREQNVELGEFFRNRPFAKK